MLTRYSDCFQRAMIIANPMDVLISLFYNQATMQRDDGMVFVNNVHSS